jgi:hypothetical protein
MSKPITKGKIITVTPPLTEGAYHASDCIGGKFTLADALMGDGSEALLAWVMITDANNQKPALEIVIFNANPTAATLTDNAAIAFSTNLANVVARIAVASTDWATVGGVGIANVYAMRMVEGSVGSNHLYAAVMVVGTPTYVAHDDLVFKFGLDRY